MKVGFIGLGHMGAAMAGSLLQAGHAVTVYDNFARGGFAGPEPVDAVENFRCAYDKVPR